MLQGLIKTVWWWQQLEEETEADREGGKKKDGEYAFMSKEQICPRTLKQSGLSGVDFKCHKLP